MLIRNLFFYLIHQVPNPVKNFRLLNSTENKLVFEWELPNGLVDSFYLICDSGLNSTGSAAFYSQNLTNTTSSSACTNLNPKTFYLVKISSLKTIDSIVYSSFYMDFFWTRKKIDLQILYVFYFRTDFFLTPYKFLKLQNTETAVTIQAVYSFLT
jgi:hypothetical protein